MTKEAKAPGGTRTPSPTYERRIQTLCLLVLTAIMIAVALKMFASVLIPFVLAVFFTLCLFPLIDVQMNYLRMPRWAAVTTTMLIGAAIIAAVVLLVTAAISEVVENKEAYQEQIEEMARRFTVWIRTEKMGIDIEELADSFVSNVGNVTKELIEGTVTNLMSMLSNAVLVLLFVIFMLASKGANGKSISAMDETIISPVKRYSIILVFISITTGALVGTALAMLNVPFAWLFGFLALLLNFIPNIGSIIATLLPLPVLLLSKELPISSRVLAILIPGTIQFIVGNVIHPKLMGKSLNLHPVAVLLSLVFFGAIWGIPGMFLAAPITAVLKILLERFAYTRNLARLLEGQFGLPET